MREREETEEGERGREKEPEIQMDRKTHLYFYPRQSLQVYGPLGCVCLSVSFGQVMEVFIFSQ